MTESTGTSNDAAWVRSIFDQLFEIAAGIEITRGVEAALSGTPDSIGDRVRDRLLRNDETSYGSTEDELADALVDLDEAAKSHPAVASMVEALRGRYLV